MGGIIGIIVCIIAIVLLARGDHPVAFPIAIIVTALNIISFLVMLKYIRYPEAAPDFWTRVNFLSVFTGIILMVVSFF